MLTWSDSFTTDHIANSDYDRRPWQNKPTSVDGYAVSGGHLTVTDGQQVSILDKRSPIAWGWTKVTVSCEGYWDNIGSPSISTPESWSEICIGIGLAELATDAVAATGTNLPRYMFGGALVGQNNFTMFDHNSLPDGFGDDSGRRITTGVNLPASVHFTAKFEMTPDGNMKYTVQDTTGLTRIWTTGPADYSLYPTSYAVGYSEDPGNLDAIVAQLPTETLYPGFSVSMQGEMAYLTNWSYEIERPSVAAGSIEVGLATSAHLLAGVD